MKSGGGLPDRLKMPPRWTVEGNRDSDTIECNRYSVALREGVLPQSTQNLAPNDLETMSEPMVQRSMVPCTGLIRPTRLEFSKVRGERLTHYLFRYPAKFHPPVAHALIERYSEPGHWVLDCFCGSGTLLVEALTLGRHALGTDVDPVAAWVSAAKTNRYNADKLERDVQPLRRDLRLLSKQLAPWREHAAKDIGQRQFNEVVTREGLWLPAIPNIHHWFRRGVLIDLARLHRAVTQLDVSRKHKQLVLLCFVSILRNVSNADPVPVSGLEVTAHMKRKEEAGRVIDVFEQYERALEKALRAVAEWGLAYPEGIAVSVKRADVRDLQHVLQQRVNVIITSPPYFKAVDYYRRHALEMYWLSLTKDHAARLELLPRYIGRAQVRAVYAERNGNGAPGPLVAKWLKRISKVCSRQSNAFAHYTLAMERAFIQMGAMLHQGGPLVLVVGNSQWKGQAMPTCDIITELAAPAFSLHERLYYPVQNRYMSYTRHNGADINTEHVLVFRKK
jgi:tRNA G10  N-methylase Trm11